MQSDDRGTAGSSPSCFRIIPSLLASVLALAIVPAAEATTTTWYYTAVVRDYYSGGSGGSPPASFVAAGIDVGTLVTGFFVVDDTLPDALPGDPTTGSYPGALLGGQLVAGDLTLDLLGGGVTAALDRNTTSLPEAFSAYKLYSSVVSSSLPQLLNFEFFQLDLVDTGQEVITTEALPTGPPDLADVDAFNPATAFYTGVTFGFGALNSGIVRAELTSLSVPEPRTGLLLALGLFAAMEFPRRRSRGPGCGTVRPRGVAHE
jgi:hypothetical protein